MNGIKATCTSKLKGWSPYFDSRLLAIGVLVGLAYYFAAQIGFALTFPPHRVSLMWIPNSVLLAAFLLLPVRTWLFLLATAFGAHLAVELQSGVPLSMALCWFVSNSCEAVLGAVLTRLLIRGPVSFGTFRNITIFFVCGVLVASFLSSFLNATCVVLNR